MKLQRDERLVDESAQYALRMHCEDCALWDDERDRCAHGYPTNEHRRPTSPSLPVVFCKDFELA